MSDLATVYTDLLTGADLALDADGLGLATDAGLTTAVVLSLFTDARAADGDELPAGETDRRGWWGDLAPLAPGYQLGSRLWLLKREKQTDAVLRRAELYAEAALAWLIEAGAARAVQVTATAPRQGLLWLAIRIERPDGAAQTWQYAWDAMHPAHEVSTDAI
jgi:phage gp46-like protein